MYILLVVILYCAQFVGNFISAGIGNDIRGERTLRDTLPQCRFVGTIKNNDNFKQKNTTDIYLHNF
jgi:hypothetical protein